MASHCWLGSFRDAAHFMIAQLLRKILKKNTLKFNQDFSSQTKLKKGTSVPKSKPPNAKGSTEEHNTNSLCYFI
jgi:hypothetical protein